MENTFFYYKEVTKVPDCMQSGQEKMARRSIEF